MLEPAPVHHWGAFGAADQVHDLLERVPSFADDHVHVRATYAKRVDMPVQLEEQGLELGKITVGAAALDRECLAEDLNLVEFVPLAGPQTDGHNALHGL